MASENEPTFAEAFEEFMRSDFVYLRVPRLPEAMVGSPRATVYDTGGQSAENVTDAVERLVEAARAAVREAWPAPELGLREALAAFEGGGGDE